MNIILIATECFPFALTTSLGNIVYTLAKELENKGHKIRVIIPRYGYIDPQSCHLERMPLEPKVSLNGTQITSSVFKGILPHTMTSLFFLESQTYYSNSKETYPENISQEDLQNRNLFFSLAALEVILKLKLNPDIIHVFNRHASFIPALLRKSNIEYSQLSKSKIIFTIQDSMEGIIPSITTNVQEAIHYSDAVTTISKQYKQELLSNTDIAEPLVKKGGLFINTGINLDQELFDPETDGQIAQQYSKGYFTAGKKKCKEDLLEILEKEKDTQAPLFGITGLTSDLEFCLNSLEELASLNIHLVIFNKENSPIEKDLLKLRSKYKNVSVLTGNKLELEKKIYAGCDFFISLDKTHQDGLPILIAMRYGSIPIAYNSGGAAEIIIDDDTKEAFNGITFRNYKPRDLANAVTKALSYYKNKENWTNFVKQVMSINTDPANSTENHINCYQAAINPKADFITSK